MTETGVTGLKTRNLCVNETRGETNGNDKEDATYERALEVHGGRKSQQV